MTASDNALDADELIALVRDDDGAAAQDHLDAGFPIYIRDDATPPGCVVKVYPDGREEFVRFADGVEHRVQAAA